MDPALYLKPGLAARLILTDGTTLAGTVARSGQWGVHRLNKVTVYTRIDPERVAGHFLVHKRNVLFAQISPPEVEED